MSTDELENLYLTIETKQATCCRDLSDLSVLVVVNSPNRKDNRASRAQLLHSLYCVQHKLPASLQNVLPPQAAGVTNFSDSAQTSERPVTLGLQHDRGGCDPNVFRVSIPNSANETRGDQDECCAASNCTQGFGLPLLRRRNTDRLQVEQIRPSSSHITFISSWYNKQKLLQGELSAGMRCKNQSQLQKA